MPSVLLFRPDDAMPGGVVNYYSAILDKFSDAVKIDSFKIGRRSGFWGYWVFYPFQFLWDCLRLLWVAATRRHDVYHFNPSLNASAFLRDSILIVLLGLFRQCRILVFFRGWEDACFDSLVNNRLSLAYFRYVLSLADHILVLASTNRNALLELGVPPQRVEITSTTFDGEFLRPDALAKDPSPAPCFLFMSRLVERKGVHELIDAAQQLQRAGFNFNLVIAGEGPAEPAIREHLSRSSLGDRVSLPGYLRGEAKAAALMSADVFLLPTYHGEGCPNCLLEAMGAGLPVITTRVGGIPDIVEDPANGCLLNEVTPHAIAAGMRMYLENPALRERVATTNRERAWSLYEANVVARRLESVYDTIVATA